MKRIKRKTAWILLTLTTLLTSCSATVQSTGRFAAPTRPKLLWRDDGERVSLSKEQAVALYRYLVDVDAYVTKTGGK